MKMKKKIKEDEETGEGWNMGYRILDMGRIKREVEGGRGQEMEEKR